MFVGCLEISIYITVTQVQHVRVILNCSLPWVDLLSFLVTEGTGKIAWLWFATNINTQANTVFCFKKNLTATEANAQPLSS